MIRQSDLHYRSCATIGGNPTANYGVTPYTYHWSPSASLNSATISNPCASPTVTTTYTVTVTDHLGCTATDNVTVTVNPKPTVTVTASPSSTICTGFGTILTASGATSYSWSPSTGLSATTGTSVTASPTTTTTYTVTGTDNNGCTNTSSITVTVASPPPAFTISGNFDNCATTCQYTISPFTTTNTTWTWSVNGSPAQAFTTNPFTINWGTSGLNLLSSGGTITVTATNSGCTTTSTFKVSGCCQGDGNVKVYNDTTINATPNPQVSNGSIIINGILTISGTNTNVIWSADKVKLGSNAKIIINQGCTLYITNNSDLYACSSMWDGIYVNGTGIVNIDGSSIIEDAINAVVSNTGGVFKISQSTLLNNYNNIIINPYSGTYSSYIKGSKLYSMKTGLQKIKPE